jgi:hypothetical protein
MEYKIIYKEAKTIFDEKSISPKQLYNDYKKCLKQKIKLRSNNINLLESKHSLLNKISDYYSEIYYLNNRNLFQRIFNVQYKTNKK